MVLVRAGPLSGAVDGAVRLQFVKGETAVIGKRHAAAIVAMIICVTPVARAAVLTSLSFQVPSSAGPSGLGSSTSEMVFSDGTSFSGGSLGVQGASSTKLGGGNAVAANVAFKFSIGSAVDALNAQYGAGNWSIANPKLTLQYTLYASSTRFGGGAGTYDVYWVAKDSWVQGTADAAYATSGPALLGWSGGQADVGTVNYDWTTPGYVGTAADATNSNVWVTDKTGAKQATVSYAMAADPSFVSDVTGATAGANPNVSLYLMGTSAGVGQTIFTGGGTSLPTLSFDVVSAPEPCGMMLVAGAGWVLARRRQRRNRP